MASKKARRKRKNKAALKTITVIIGLAAAAYSALCAVGSRGETFRKNTVVNGVPLENLNVEQARELLGKRFDGTSELDGENYASIQLLPDIPDYTDAFELDVKEALVWDFADTLSDAYESQRGGNFFLQGYHLLRGGRNYTVLPYVENGEVLAAKIAATGILNLDTSVDGACEVQSDKLTITRGKNGYRVDEAALVADILENTKNGNYEPITCKAKESLGAGLDLQAIHDEIYAVKVDPTITVAADRSYEIVPAVRGVDFDVAAALAAVEAAEEGTVLEFPLEIEEPVMTTEAYKECLFRDKLSGYTTDVGGSDARRSNVRLAAASCNGYILLPGESFDYNTVVGQRTAAAGYQAAPAYQGGETVNELGGGVCQVSSTLYCACMYANLKITRRSNHTYVSSYVPIGMDATVSWGGPDFTFENDTDYPIKIKSTYENGRLHFEIFGTDVNHYNVEITSKTLATISAPVKQVEDPNVEEGTTYTKTNGHTGYQVQTYRHVYDEAGKLVWEGEEAYSNYSTSDHIIIVGTKKKPEPPKVETPTEGGTPEASETPAEGGE